MQARFWSKAIQDSADPRRARQYLEQFSAAGGAPIVHAASAEQARILAALFSGSRTLSELLIAKTGWAQGLTPELLQYPRRRQGLQRDADALLKPYLELPDPTAPLAQVRLFKQREMLRIAARDLARLANAVEITREISDVADVCLDAVWQVCWRRLVARFGQPHHQDAQGRWRPTAFCVLGLGKLGGQELNYSSDVDVLFVYDEEGQVFKELPRKDEAPRPVMTSHQFFNRFAEEFIAEVARVTPDGMLYRVDLRLRPEGDAGPLCRSLASCENYYAQWGQTWERMMLIKARCVAGDAALGGEFLEMIQSFRFPRSVGEGVLREVAAIKGRIENEILRSGEVERNVKLGRGGIREIEFIVQTQQLLHAGHQPFLQNPQTLPCLAKLAQYKLLATEEAEQLDAAYRFLRDVEHRLQMEDNLQTHTIPENRHAQERLAKLMGFKSLAEFEAARQNHTGNVRRVYDRLLKSQEPEPESPFPREFAGAEADWKRILAQRGFKDADKAYRVLKEFVEGPGYVHVSPRTVDMARQLLPKLFALCPEEQSKVLSPMSKVTNSRTRTPSSKPALEAVADQPAIENRQSKILSDPDRVVTRLDSFISAYGTRATLFELWNSNPAVFTLVLLLFDRSEFLAETLIRSPELLDDLVFGGRLRLRKTAQEILEDLLHGLDDEDQYAWLRRYHEAERMRIGLRDILGLADFEQNLAELSALADACLQYALQVVMRRNKIKKPPFVIIGLGKLGGGEINYGSDLDIIFVAGSKAKNLPRFQRVAADVMDLLSNRTERGMVFHTDARLRPDGEKGLLVNTLDAYEEYYHRRAQLWEIQALTRTRPVAGEFKLGHQFQRLAAMLTDFKAFSSVAAGRTRVTRSNRKSEIGNRKLSEPLHVGCDTAGTPPACFASDWKRQIHQMRMRIEKERTPPGKDALAIKTGSGGFMDAEFIAQTLCLEQGWQEAHTLRALERARDAGVLPDAEKLLENYTQLRRVESILRRWSYEGETVLPDDLAPYYRVSVRCGFATPEAFRDALGQWRKAIREVYEQVFSAKAPGRTKE